MHLRFLAKARRAGGFNSRYPAHMSSDGALMLDGRALTLDEVEAVARHGRPVALADDARTRVEAARAIVEKHAAGDEPVYGVNTGFGSLARHRIPPDHVREVQRNLLRSHAAGVGEPLPEEVVRAMMLLLAAMLGRGHSGARGEVIDLILSLLNRNITPIVPSRGSVGASGDLAPLAHLALVLIGEGQATLHSRNLPGMAALRMAGLEAITLEAKEGLALINGTHMMAAIGALAMCDTRRIVNAAVQAAAMAVDACRGTDRTLDPRIHAVRNQPGQQRIAAMMRQLLSGSQIVRSHTEHDPRVQDPYCLRAAPQVIGAAADAIDCVRGSIECELGAVSDNPLVFHSEFRVPSTEYDMSQSEPGTRSSELILPGANFHGMPLAIPLDVLPIALCHIAGIAERRVNWLLAASDSENPVNIYLSPQPGLHSGLMIAQYTAAACCNELQTLAHPASVHNLPTSAGMEDYNSMGATSALKARAAVELARNVVAIELLVMSEAMEYQRPLRSGVGVERTYETVRGAVPRLTADRPPSPDIAAIARLVADGSLDEAMARGDSVG
jgi:histidine ammonia-lyase